MIDIRLLPDKPTLGSEAAALGAAAIRDAIAMHGEATIVVATGASQFEMLERLVASDIDWSRVTAFHLDEYAGLPESHPASFRRYLQERFVRPTGDRVTLVPVDGDAEDPEAEAGRLSALIAERRIDVCFAGIGENGHLAFNDPPADLEIETPFILVELDEACRRQQHGEGWFPTLDAVPRRAISMSVRQMLRADLIVLCASDARKAAAVRDAVEGEVTPWLPASALQRHLRTVLFLDPPAASLLARPPG